MATQPLDRYLELIAPEYKHSTNFLKYLKVLMQTQQTLHTALEEGKIARYLSNAEGAQLEVIGYIVGQAKGTYKTIAGEFFGFSGALGAKSFGTLGDLGIGGVFLSSGDTQINYVVPDDNAYRRFIEARIMRNQKRLSVETMIEIVQKITDEPIVHITEGTLSFNVHIPRLLADDEKLLISDPNLIPTPVGVSISFSDNSGQFG